MIKIPVYQPSLGGNERKYVNECIDTNWISSKGRFVGEFESAFARHTGVRHAATVSNGTVALHAALLALGIGPGDQVIVPTLTYVAPVNAIAYTGATPVFVDSLASTWQMDPAAVSARVTGRTRAVLAVHLYGQPCDMNALAAVARERGLLLVEDCAEAFGSRIGGRHVGNFGDVATYSFYGNKTVTTGEGGMVVTNDAALHERIVRLKGQGLAANREYWHDIVGYNYRMTNICAAIGLAQLERADRLLARKRRIAERYRDSLAGLPLQFHAETAGVTHSYWMCSIRVHEARDRDALRRHLERSGIETRPLFNPVHTMPMYAGGGEHPVAEDLARCGVNLPSWPEMENDVVDKVVDAVRQYYATSGTRR
jgi:perosamine synthetase